MAEVGGGGYDDMVTMTDYSTMTLMPGCMYLDVSFV